jgi:pyruvate/2-oxoglutarate dehydrogenase complex dihydrolipoamide dehydrogenase (E3) component
MDRARGLDDDSGRDQKVTAEKIIVAVGARPA